MDFNFLILVGIVSIFMYFVSVRNNEYIKIINRYASIIDNLEKRISSLNKYIDDLKDTLNRKSSNFYIAKSKKYYFPFPFWMKDSKGCYIYFNEEFENLLKKGSEELLGKTDLYAWGKEDFQKHLDTDEITSKSLKKYEVFDDLFPGMTTKKWVYKIENETIFYYGCCLEKK